MTTPGPSPDNEAAGPNGEQQYGQQAPEQPLYGRAAPGQYGQQQSGFPQYGQAAPGQQYGDPQYGQPQYGQPQYGQPHYGQPQFGAMGPNMGPGYTPPSMLGLKPGIIPLRPLSLGEVFDGAINGLRRNFRVTIGLTLAIVTIAMTITTAIGVVLLPWISTRFGRFVDDINSAGDSAGSLSYFDQQGILSFGNIGLALSTIVVTGTLVFAFGQLVLGIKPSAADIWRQVRPRIWALFGLAILTGLITFALIMVPVLLTVLAARANSGFAVLTGVLLGLVGLVAIVAVTVLLSFAPAVLILESQRIIQSLRRSWRLVRPLFWRIFGIQILTYLISSVVQSVLAIPLTLVAVLVGASTGNTPILILLLTLSSILGAAISVAFSSGVNALLYIDARMRREGLDVALAAKAAGR